MRFLALTREPRLYSSRRFVESAAKMGHRMETMDITNVMLELRSGDPSISYHGKRVNPNDFHVALPRIGASVTEQGCNVVRQLESMRMPVVNGSRAIQRSRDKLRALQFLSRIDVQVPTTVLLQKISDLDAAIAAVGGLPCVLKLLQGTQGVGVMLVESREAIESVLQAFWSLEKDVILQEFIAESKGKDVRAFVVGDKVVAAMRRQAALGEFRSNIHRGGVGVEVELPRETERILVEASQSLELGVCGVDYLESKDGPKIIELNSSPGFEGLERAVPIDIARHVIEYMEKLAREAKR